MPWRLTGWWRCPEPACGASVHLQAGKGQEKQSLGAGKGAIDGCALFKLMHWQCGTVCGGGYLAVQLGKAMPGSQLQVGHAAGSQPGRLQG